MSQAVFQFAFEFERPNANSATNTQIINIIIFPKYDSWQFGMHNSPPCFIFVFTDIYTIITKAFGLPKPSF